MNVCGNEPDAELYILSLHLPSAPLPIKIMTDQVYVYFKCSFDWMAGDCFIKLTYIDAFQECF